jgi:acylphosphatase
VVVAGDVQGVFFRDTCRRVASSLGVHGSAHNLPDGRVEVHLEGEADAVDEVVDWCRNGPPMANVYDVEVTDEEPRGAAGFSIA